MTLILFLTHTHTHTHCPRTVNCRGCKRASIDQLLSSCLLCSEKRKLQVNVSSPIQCSMNGRKCTVVVETKINQSRPDFTKSRSGYILAVPGN